MRMYSRFAAIPMMVALLMVGCVLLTPLAAASTRLELKTGWRFCTDVKTEGESGGWTQNIPQNTEEVTLPHTWSQGKNTSYEGWAWYFKQFPKSDALNGKHVELHFGATFYKSRVWLNGKLLGEHEGGYTEYYFDITPYMQAENILAVEINNSPGVDTIPGRALKASPTSRIYDWWPYGGIVRGAWLTISESAVARWQHIDSVVAKDGADVSDRVMLENFTTHSQNLVVSAAVIAQEGGEPIASQTRSITVQPGSQDVTIPVHINSPHLWGIDNPYLYKMVITVAGAGGKVLDSINDDFGVRTIEIHDRHLYLNGQQVRLSGLTRHEESPWEGLAETEGTILHDFDDMKNLETTLTRPVHYPQNPLIYEYADHKGILMIPEIPMWQFSEDQMKNPKVITLAKQMLKELIDQNYNHPSIFAWSVDNESATNTPGGIAYFKTMYAWAKQLNPARAVSCADDMITFVKDPKTNASSLADFIMWNEYYGTWDAPESLLPAAFDRIEHGYPDKMVIVSEFGVPGLYATNATTADQLRVEIIHKHLEMYRKHDWIAGAILWCYEDYPSYHNLRPGQDDHYVDHGVVDKNRQRKPSYYVWQRENEPAHVEVAWKYDSQGTPNGFVASVARREVTELPAYELLNYKLEWRVVDLEGKEIAVGEQVFPQIGAAQSVSASWNVPMGKHFHLLLKLMRPTEFPAVTRTLTWHTPEPGGYDGSPAE